MKKFISVFIISLMLAVVLTGSVFAASDVLYKGTGTSFTWKIYDDGELEITGDYIDEFAAGKAPWYKYRGYVTEITVGKSITDIGGYAFYGMDSVETVDLASTVTSIGPYAFANCTSLEEIEIPTKVTAINTGVFSGCKRLEYVDLPSGLLRIRTKAFYGCKSLQEITLPAKLDTIGDSAFMECDSLEDVYFLGDAPTNIPSNYEMFDEDNDDLTLYYISGSTGFTKAPWRYYNTDTFKYSGTVDKGDDDDGWLDDDDDSDVWYGDLNKDGKINSTDSKIMRYCLALNKNYDPDDYEARGDVDKDGKLTPMDDVVLARYIAGFKGYSMPKK